jgi:hypothetical protein
VASDQNRSSSQGDRFIGSFQNEKEEVWEGQGVAGYTSAHASTSYLYICEQAEDNLPGYQPTGVLLELHGRLLKVKVSEPGSGAGLSIVFAHRQSNPHPAKPKQPTTACSVHGQMTVWLVLPQVLLGQAKLRGE